MWQPLQILAGLAVIVAGVIVFRGLRRSPPTPGWAFWLLRLLRRLAGVLIVLIGLGVTFEGTPYMTANICLDIRAPNDWCFGGDGTDAALLDEAAGSRDEEADTAEQR
jgi:hypothetical protein